METVNPDIQSTPAAPIVALYDALARSDMATAAGTLTPDTVLHVPGTGINAGTYRGRDAVLEFIGSAAALTDGTLRLVLHRAFADDEWGVALATYTATRAGRPKPLANHLAHVVRLADGQIAEGWLQARDQYAVDEFWAA